MRRIDPRFLETLFGALLLGACNGEVREEPDSETNWEHCESRADCRVGEICASLRDGEKICVDDGDSHGAGGSPEDGGALVDAGPAPPPLVGCSYDAWPPAELASDEAVPPLLAGVWSKCGGGEPVNLDSPFEFTADGRFYRLEEKAEGGFERLTGLTLSGSYELRRDSDLVLILTYDGAPSGSTLTSNLSLTAEPHRMLYGPAVYAPVPSAD